MTTQQSQDEQQLHLQQLTQPQPPLSSTQSDTSGVTPLLLDSLPYVDPIHPDYEAYALTLIEEEMAQHPPPPPQQEKGQNQPFRLTDIPNFAYNNSSQTDAAGTPISSINQEEYKQLVARNGQKRNPQQQQQQVFHFLSNLTDELPPQPSSSDNDKSTATNSIRTAKIRLAHEKIRQINLELYAICASHMWKQYVQQLDNHVQPHSKRTLDQQLLRVDQLNATRKQMQEDAVKNQLGKLEYRWIELIRKIQHLNQGVQILEEEIGELTKSL